MIQSNSPVVGIDLGTTNSVVAAYYNGQVQVIQENGESIIPSVVGLAMDGKLIVGQTAEESAGRIFESNHRPRLNAAWAKRSNCRWLIRSFAARNQCDDPTSLAAAGRTCPWRRGHASGDYGAGFLRRKQRQATREAGALAWTTVERIINEPTAASLVYHAGESECRHLIVYDLGRWDVRCVDCPRGEGVVEVLSSQRGHAARRGRFRSITYQACG